VVLSTYLAIDKDVTAVYDGNFRHVYMPPMLEWLSLLSRSSGIVDLDSFIPHCWIVIK
jgi:hypothetical protein